MKKLFFIIAVLILIPFAADADTIVFKDGTRIDVPKAWEENGEVKCNMAGIVIGYPKAEVKQIISRKQSVVLRKLKPSEMADVARSQPGSCYDLGKRFGYCTTLILYGELCDNRDDIRLPSKCRNNRDKEKGLREGIRLAYKTLDLSSDTDRQTSPMNSVACFDLGKRFGKCSTLTMYGKRCAPEDDVVMPLECREQPDTQNGINMGVRAAYRSLGLPTE
jgi:hypothetical protein